MSVPPIDYLFNRRSVKFVQAPGPTDEHLSQILQAGMSAPDHGRLRPWRFTLIRGDAVQRWADFAIGAIKRAGLPLTTQKEASTRDWLSKVPLLVALDRKSTRLNSSHVKISYAVFCLKKKITV